MRYSELHRRSVELKKLAQVDAYQQKTEWSCSAGTLKAVLQHYGIDISEEEIVKAVGARKGRGAETTDIVEGARKLGLDATEKSFSSLDEAKKVLKQGVPIIADIQSFNYPGKGHYIVIAGYKPGKGFIVMDPNTKGKTAVDNWRVLSDEKLEEIWWDRAMAPPHKLMKKWGIMVKPKAQEKTAALITEEQCRSRAKLANGDMLAYFRDHPQKLKEYNERQATKKKYKNSPEGRKNQAAWRKRKATMGKTANDPVKEKLTLHGIPLSLEWRKGETRKYFNHDPLKKKSTGTIDYNKKMKADYGYVRGVMDADGEELDVYLGPNRESTKVFVLEKLRSSDASFDENKIMLGYDSKEEAKKSYLQHQGKDELGKIREITLGQFKKEFLSKKKTASGDSNEAMRLAAKKRPTAQEKFYAKKKTAIFTGGGGGSGYGDGAPTPPNPMGKSATNDPLGWQAIRRAKSESASARPSWGKVSAIKEAAFADEICKIAGANPAGTALQALSLGSKAGGFIGGMRESIRDGEESKLKRVVKGVGMGAIIGALVALGLQRNAVGKGTLPRL